MTDLPLFKGEAMLLRWSDSSANGMTVTFALHPDECGDAHPFRGLGTGKFGQRFALMCVPLSDDETPEAVTVTPASTTQKEALPEAAGGDLRPPINAQASASGRSYTLSNFVGMTCGKKEFQAWVARCEGADPADVDAEFAAGWVREKCGVKTRADIVPGSLAEIEWKRIETAFMEATGQMAEVRG